MEKKMIYKQSMYFLNALQDVLYVFSKLVYKENFSLKITVSQTKKEFLIFYN